MSNIIIQGAREGNLKNISLEIPRDKLVVLTGVSGSGKSTLAMDVIYQECQRQHLEAIGYQGFRKPDLDRMRNASPTIRISQTEANRNPRSTVGTLTNIYTDLRMVYEKLGVRVCPHCHELISSTDCKEETEKRDGEFKVYMYCSHCHSRMDKLTRTHFSYNTREGACPKCQGLGKALTINQDAIINEALSLEDGAVAFWDHAYRDYQVSCLYNSFRHYGVPVAKKTPVAEFGELQKAILYHGVESDEVKQASPDTLPPKTVMAGRFEGIFPTLWRRMSEKGGDAKQLNDYFDFAVCSDCQGERLGELSRNVTVANARLPELSDLSLEELHVWVMQLEASLKGRETALVDSYLLDLKTKLQRIIRVGLGYLSLDRQIITLSGGELQRLKLAAALDSDLTGVIYIMDEPTVGLHPRDTAGMITILKRLRDLGNTVLVIEHDPDVMEQADYVIDIGPGSGKHGGEIIGVGTLDELKQQASSVTGAFLQKTKPVGRQPRAGTGEMVTVSNANLFNLKDVSVSIPVGCMTAVTGVSGSGKSTLIFEVLASLAEKKQSHHGIITGLEQFDQIITIEQAALAKTKRSNVATYSEVYTEIRQIFAGLDQAREQGLTAKHFSFNTKGGRCENCEGLGYVTSNMLFFESIEVTCPVCGGKQFSDEVLAIHYQGHSIHDILHMSVEEAAEAFREHRKIVKALKLLEEVGLGYLELGQSLTTLSGGEGQRLKLAKELISSKGNHTLYLMDEPTTGLHPLDIENFLVLLDRIVAAGNTVVVVEHNQQVIRAADWIIDLGPEGGNKGGKVLFEGSPAQFRDCQQSITAQYLYQGE